MPQRRGAAAPPDAAALRSSAQAALSGTNFADAERYYKQLTEISPDDADAWHGLANALDAQERQKEADPLYLRAASIYKEQYKKNPTNASLLYNLALSTACGGDDAKAREYASEGIRKFPDDKNLARLNDLFNGKISNQ